MTDQHVVYAIWSLVFLSHLFHLLLKVVCFLHLRQLNDYSLSLSSIFSIDRYSRLYSLLNQPTASLLRINQTENSLEGVLFAENHINLMAVPVQGKAALGLNGAATTTLDNFQPPPEKAPGELNKESDGAESAPRSSSEQKRDLSRNSEDEDDQNIVGWNGPSDPENPMNWASHKRVYHVVLVSVITFIS